MAGRLRTRGEEVTVQLLVDGESQEGGFLKMETFKAMVKKDMPENDFLGATRSEFDVQIHGYELTWTIQETDSTAEAIMDQVAAAQDAGVPGPTLSVVVRKQFRDPALTPEVYVYIRGVLSMEDTSFSSRKDYVKSSWTFKAAERRKIS